MAVASFGAELARKEDSEPGITIGQLIERDLCSGSTDLYDVGWRDVLTKSIFCFLFCCFVLVILGVLLGFRCLAAWLLLSPFSAWQRPRCLIGGCFEAAGVVGAAEVGMVEDRAERRPNMRNKSSIFRYRGVYLAYRSATVRQFPYVGGGGDNTRYCGGGEGGDGDGGSDALFSSGGGDGDGRNKDFGEHVGEGEDEDLGKDLDEEADEDRGCFWHSSRRCRCRRFFDENTMSQCLQDGLLHTSS